MRSGALPLRRLPLAGEDHDDRAPIRSDPNGRRHEKRTGIAADPLPAGSGAGATSVAALPSVGGGVRRGGDDALPFGRRTAPSPKAEHRSRRPAPRPSRRTGPASHPVPRSPVGTGPRRIGSGLALAERSLTTARPGPHRTPRRPHPRLPLARPRPVLRRRSGPIASCPPGRRRLPIGPCKSLTSLRMTVATSLSCPTDAVTRRESLQYLFGPARLWMMWITGKTAPIGGTLLFYVHATGVRTARYASGTFEEPIPIAKGSMLCVR